MANTFKVGVAVTFFGESGQVVEGPDDEGWLIIQWDKSSLSESRIHRAEQGLSLADNRPKVLLEEE